MYLILKKLHILQGQYCRSGCGATYHTDILLYDFVVRILLKLLFFQIKNSKWALF